MSAVSLRSATRSHADESVVDVDEIRRSLTSRLAAARTIEDVNCAAGIAVNELALYSIERKRRRKRLAYIGVSLYLASVLFPAGHLMERFLL